MKEQKPKMVLIHSKADSYFPDKTTLVDFLKALAIYEEVDFWYDKEAARKTWDKQINQQLNEADIIVFLITTSFLKSRYMKEVTARIASERKGKGKGKGRLLVVPVMLERTDLKRHSWLSKYQHLPKDGTPILPNHSQDLADTFKEIIDYVRDGILDRLGGKEQNRKLSSLRSSALYPLRRVSDVWLTEEERETLREDAERRAKEFVPNGKLRRRICRAAKDLLEKNKGVSLSKSQLERLDKDFLIPLAPRRKEPDAEIVRWVLRAAGLHSQGRRPHVKPRKKPR